MVAARRRVSTDSEASDAATRESKRMRVEHVDSQPSQVIDSSDEEDLIQDDPSPLPADEDGYVEGSIVKITLRNFVTYDYCEFSPGPQLNMIIGPNGTGKSTIVCAIALGLGGSPALLGRAKNIAEFVKTGEDEAAIKIELKQTGGKPNVVIQRNITKANNATTWRVNGRAAPLKEVLSIVNRLNIQVDNLCQFLPQDKVAEFAQLAPPQLLEKTQIAAGARELSQWHEKLIVWRQDEKALEKTKESDENHLKTLKERNQHLEKDVMRMRQREELMKRIAILKAKLPLAKCSDSKKAYDEAKAIEQEKRAEVQRLEGETEPIRSVIASCEQSARQITEIRNQLLTSVPQLGSRLKKISAEIANSRNETKLTKMEIKNVKQRNARRQEEIAKLENKIAKMTEKIGEEPPSDDTTELNRAIEDIDRELRTLGGEMSSLAFEYRDARNAHMENENAVKAKKAELEAFNDVAKRRLNQLAQKHRDTVKAYEWLRQNRNKFKGKIHGPVVMQINVKDQRYADIVESILSGENGPHLRTFVCENKEDYELFTAELIDKMHLQLVVAWPDKIDQSQIETSMPLEELREKYGMEYFVSSLLTGPKLLIDYLCMQCRINLVPVSLRHANEELLSRDAPFRRYACHDSVFEVKTYTYGRGGKQVTAKQVRRSVYLADSLDNELRTRVRGELAQLERKLEESQQVLDNINNRRNVLKQKESELKHAREDKIAEKRNIQMSRMQWNKAKAHLESLERELDDLKSRPVEEGMAIEHLEQKIVSQACQRAQLCVKYKQVLEQYVDCVLQRNVTQLEHMQATEKYTAVKSFADSQTRLLQQAQAALQQAIRITQQKKSIANAHHEEAQRAGRSLPDDLKEEFKEIYEQWRSEGLDQTQMEVEDAIKDLEAKADVLRATNPRAMEQYEARLAEIKKLTEKMEADDKRLAELKQEIETVRSQWEPRLESLVSRISAGFSTALERIGCAGEVCISRDDYFDKWGIEIRVKFRDNEKLQLLTGQRQSGGERAVSTILYLMALQNLAKSPFRVVDEINQGMDPRNERMIHEQIVKGASRPGTAQYFLITPKLLPNLYYNERMRILCIYNGEWQPPKLKPLAEYLRAASVQTA